MDQKLDLDNLSKDQVALIYLLAFFFEQGGCGRVSRDSLVEAIFHCFSNREWCLTYDEDIDGDGVVFRVTKVGET